MKNFQVFIQKEEDWFVAHNIELGIASQWKTIDESLIMIKEATELYLEDEKELNFVNQLAKQYFLTSITI